MKSGSNSCIFYPKIPQTERKYDTSNTTIKLNFEKKAEKREWIEGKSDALNCHRKKIQTLGMKFNTFINLNLIKSTLWKCRQFIRHLIQFLHYLNTMANTDDLTIAILWPERNSHKSVLICMSIDSLYCFGRLNSIELHLTRKFHRSQINLNTSGKVIFLIESLDQICYVSFEKCVSVYMLFLFSCQISCTHETWISLKKTNCIWKWETQIYESLPSAMWEGKIGIDIETLIKMLMPKLLSTCNQILNIVYFMSIMV